MTSLFDAVLKSSLILLIGLALMPLLRRQSAALRHWVLTTTMFCAAVVPIVGRLAPEWEAPITIAALVPLESVDAIPAGAPAGSTPRPSPPADATAVDNPLEPGETLGDMAMRVWLAGIALSLATLIAGLIRLRRLNATATRIEEGAWAESLELLRLRHGWTRPIRLLAIKRPALLLVWGLWRPTIIVPEAALAWPRERIHAVLNHELAHIRRSDWVLQMASEVVRAVYWFNPLVWITCARMRAECEIACDDIVIANGAHGAEYASHVVDIARDLNTTYWLPAPAIVRASTLERRITAMLDKTLNRRPLSNRSRGSALALLLSFTLAIAGLAAQSFVSLSGTIVDPSNSVLPGVKLILTNEQTQAKYEIQTDRAGRYEFVGLPPGNYTMEADLMGFARFSGRVSIGSQNLQQDLTMSVGTLQETITVRQDATPPAPDPERERRIEALKQKRAASRCPDTPGTQSEGNARMGGNIRVPVKYRDVRPTYPAALHGTEGVVVLNARIGTTGAVDDVEVLSSTHAEFSQSAIEAVRQWEFDATLLNCEPIATPMKVTVTYKIK